MDQVVKNGYETPAMYSLVDMASPRKKKSLLHDVIHSVNKMKVHQVPFHEARYRRAGVVPYVDQDGDRFYAFSIGTYTAAINDFGGTREKHEDALDAALREYTEESLAVFGDLHRKNVMNLEALDGETMFLILVPVPPPFIIYTHRFDNLIRDDPAHESQAVIWFSREQLRRIVQLEPFKFYWRVWEVLRDNLSQL